MENSLEELVEKLSHAQKSRIAKKTMKKNKYKIKRAKKKGELKLKNKETLEKKATKQAIDLLVKKKVKDGDGLRISKVKEQIQKKQKKKVKLLAKKLMKQVKKDDIQRVKDNKARRSGKNKLSEKKNVEQKLTVSAFEDDGEFFGVVKVLENGEIVFQDETEKSYKTKKEAINAAKKIQKQLKLLDTL